LTRYEYSYSKQFLATIGERDQRFPWAQKKEVLYSNPGGYHRWAPALLLA
jgi:hypothetical protein